MKTQNQSSTTDGPAGSLALDPRSASVVCYCGEPAIVGIHFTNFDHRRWIPNCDRCYHTHLENAQDTNDHEMHHFGGAWGLVTWEERDIAGAIQDPTDGSLSWPNGGDEPRAGSAATPKEKNTL